MRPAAGYDCKPKGPERVSGVQEKKTICSQQKTER